MSNQAIPSLEKYANLMIEKMKEVEASDWRKPWFSQQFRGLPQNLSGRKYNNLNKAMLYFLCEKYNYQTPVFLTFAQAQKENVLIIKGQSSFPVSYYELNIKNLITGERVTKEFYNSLNKIEQKKYKVIPFLRYFNVFNLDQTNFAEKYPEKWEIIKKQFCFTEPVNDGYRNQLIDQTIEKQTWVCPIELKEQNHAFYSPGTDSITLPTIKQFSNGKEFYYTALHEMAHSTGHPERLARKFGYQGTFLYAHEELIAELSSAVTGRDLGLAVLPRKENAQYLKGWLSEITNDSKYILNILQDVNKAVTMIEEGIGLNAEQSTTQEVINSPTPVMTADYSDDPQQAKKEQDEADRWKNSETNKAITNFKEDIKNDYPFIEEKTEDLFSCPKTDTTNKEIIGTISYYGFNGEVREVIEYDNAENYLKAIEHELDCNPAGFRYKTLTSNPEVKKTVDNLAYGIYGMNNPHNIGSSIPTSSSTNEQILQSSECRTLISEIGPDKQISGYHILDKSTGKTEPLHVSDINLSKQSPEALKKMLSGQQAEMTTKSGITQMMGLSKSPAGWTLQVGKQIFNMADSSAEI